MNLSALLAVELLLLILCLRRRPSTALLTLKERIVLAFVTLSTVLCFSTEVLSLFSLLYDGPIATLHILISLGLLAALYASRQRAPQSKQGSSELPIIACATLCAIPAFITALAAPPNNWDSMTYHLPRVFHWLQNHSVNHYATYVARQLYLSPGHEFLLTHMIALAGNDLSAGMLSSAAFLMALLTTAAITERLGGNRIVQLSAIFMCATIPMAILQSSTTQNDLLLGTFLLSFILGALLTKKAPSTTIHLMMWASAGLAVLTKGLAFFYLPPAIVCFFPFSVYRRAAHLPSACLGVALALALNFGHWQRNYNSFSHPLTPTTGLHASAAFSVRTPGFSSAVSNLARNTLLHSNIAIPTLERWIQDSLAPLHAVLEIDPNSPDTTWTGTGLWMAAPRAINEDLAGNGNHALLIAVIVVVLLLTPRSTMKKGLNPLLPLICCLTGFLFLSVVLKWQPWASRLHLSLFMIATPTMALAVNWHFKTLGSILICSLLAIQAYPYWAHNAIRPLTGPSSILYQSARLERFASKPFLHQEFRRLSKHLKQTQCRDIGLISAEDEWEQPLFTNLYTRPIIHACPAPASHPRDLWLPERETSNPNICVLVWLGGDAPEQVETCGKKFARVGLAQNVSIYDVIKS